MKKTIAWHLTQKEFLAETSARRTVGIITFLCLITLGAFVYIPLPFTPVPVTLQTFFVLVCAAFLSRKDGLFVQGLYAAMGAAGLPIFSAAQGGLLKLFGPTGGYIVGFVVAIFVLKTMLELFRKSGRQLSFSQIVISMSLAAAAIFLMGSLWLGFTMKLGFSRVMMLGVLPFIPAETAKVLLASYIYYKADRRLKTLFES